MPNPSLYTYLPQAEYDRLVADLNLDSASGGVDDTRKVDYLDRAVSDLEADLSKRFVIPLVEKSGGAFTTAPYYAQVKVKNALIAKVKQVIGHDGIKEAGVVVDSTQRYIDLKKLAYQEHLKVLMDYEIDLGLKLQTWAQGSVEPVQSMHLSRADNERHTEFDGEGVF